MGILKTLTTNKNTIHFRFDMPVNQEAIFCGNLTVEGYGCLQKKGYHADIDSVIYEGMEIKPVLELLGGMEQVDAAAENYVKELFKDTQLRIANG